MITKEEMKNLAMLARVGVPDDELDQVAGEIGSILNYVDIIANTDVSSVGDEWLQVNIARPDAGANPSESYSEKLIAGAPDSQNGFYKVPKIL